MFDKVYSMLRMAALKTFIELSKHLLCSYFMVNIVSVISQQQLTVLIFCIRGKKSNSTSLTQQIWNITKEVSPVCWKLEMWIE